MLSMSNRELQIGIVGTFDVENYGDLLFPLIAEVELSQRLGPMKLHRFSYHEKTPLDWPFAVTSLSELASQANDLDALLIGGGHILRFDKGAVRENYLPPGLRVHHPTGYWLTPALIALNNGLPVAWNAPGVCGEIPEWADALMKLAINGSSYVSVRDRDSRKALERFADGETEVRLVPDTAFGLARLLDTRRTSSDYAQLRGELGLSDPYIVLQATRDLLPFAGFMRSHPQIFKAYDILVLETGPVLGDDDAMFRDVLPGAVCLPAWPNPLLLAELISHADAVVAVSLHLSISALAFGVPLFLSARAVDRKYEILAGAEGVFRFNDESAVEATLGHSCFSFRGHQRNAECPQGDQRSLADHSGLTGIARERFKQIGSRRSTDRGPPQFDFMESHRAATFLCRSMATVRADDKFFAD